MALELVKQHGFSDCGVAAIAMLLEQEYHYVWHKLTPEQQTEITEKGMTDEMFRSCVERFGFEFDKDFTKRVYLPYWGSVRACLNLLWGRRAIVSAWSKNEKDMGHFIVFDGTEGAETVLDPSTRRTYDDWKDVEPKVMWLFSEAAVTSIRLKKAVDKFLGWKLPVTFSPDCYVTFDREKAQQSPAWPIGTNLLTADEATQMFKHCLKLR